jgi:acetyl esterase/lipase
VQVPLFPEAAFLGDTLSGSENRSGLYLETYGIYEMVRNYIKNTDDGRDPYITPMNAPSHADLPPAILVTNGFDPLRDVGHAYARKLAAGGNDLTYVHNPDLTHTRARCALAGPRVRSVTGCGSAGPPSIRSSTPSPACGRPRHPWSSSSRATGPRDARRSRASGPERPSDLSMGPCCSAPLSHGDPAIDR